MASSFISSASCRGGAGEEGEIGSLGSDVSSFVHYSVCADRLINYQWHAPHCSLSLTPGLWKCLRVAASHQPHHTPHLCILQLSLPGCQSILRLGQVDLGGGPEWRMWHKSGSAQCRQVQRGPRGVEQDTSLANDIFSLCTCTVPACAACTTQEATHL